MRRTLVILALMMVALATIPALGREWTNWRYDGSGRFGTSRDTEATNTAFNPHDTLTDPLQGTAGFFPWGIFWISGDVQELDTIPGVRRGNPHDVPPGLAKKGFFSAFAPVVVDLGNQPLSLPDHLVIVPRNGLEVVPPDPGNPLPPTRGQLIAYYPRTALGLANAVADANLLNPFSVPPPSHGWIRFLHTNLAGDLVAAPLDSSNRIQLPVVLSTAEDAPAGPAPFGVPPFTAPMRLLYVVAGEGTGIANFSYVHCYAIAHDPANPATTGATPPLRVWTYRVHSFADPNIPVEVSGMAFADITDGGRSRPTLFLTTSDNQVIAINARGADTQDIAADNDPFAGQTLWRWLWAPRVGQPRVYAFGSGPAVSRVALYNQFFPGGNTMAAPLFNSLPALPQTTITAADGFRDAANNHQVAEWLVFVNGDDGWVHALNAQGETVAGMPPVINPRLRWKFLLETSPGVPETFVVPPVVANAGTPNPITHHTDPPCPNPQPATDFVGPPLIDARDYIGHRHPRSSGRPEREYGYDDVVICGGVSSRIYGLDAMGDFFGPTAVPASRQGRPEEDFALVTDNTTTERWRYPEETPGNPIAGNPPGPRNVNGTPILAAELQMRSPLLLVRGQLREHRPFTDFCYQPEVDPHVPDLHPAFQPLPTLPPNPPPPPYLPDVGGAISDHLVFVRFDQLVSNAAGFREFFEWVGSLHPYQFVELAADLDPRQTHTVTVIPDPMNPGANNFVVPNEFLRIGRRRSDPYKVVTAPTEPPGQLDTERMRSLYITRQRWIDSAGVERTLSRGMSVVVSYNDFDGGEHDELLPFPSERDPLDPGGAPLPKTSLGEFSERLQGLVNGVEQGPVRMSNAEYLAFPRPAMVANRGDNDPQFARITQPNGVIFVPSSFRGRFFVMDFRNVIQRTITHATSLDPLPPGSPTPADLADIPALEDIAWGMAVLDDWVYAVYDNGFVRAFSNGRNAGTGGGGFFPLPVGGLTGPIFTGDGGVQDPSPNNVVQRPLIRVIDAGGQQAIPIDQVPTARILPEVEMLYEWGGFIHVRVDFGVDPPGRIRENPVRLTLRGPIGGAIQTTATPQEVPAGSNQWFAYLRLQIPNASPSNPMTPGTRLLLQTPVGRRTDNTVYSMHWELEASQDNTTWADDPNDPNSRRGPWRPDTSLAQGAYHPEADPASRAPEHNSAPWISLNNPLGVAYQPSGAAPLFIVGNTNQYVGPGAPDVPERRNADPYQAHTDWSQDPVSFPPNDPRLQPAVPTIGTHMRQAGGLWFPDRQLVFGDHGRATPTSVPGAPNAAVFFLTDRSELGLRGQRLQIRAQRPTGTKLGRGAAIGLNDPTQRGSFAQNAGFLDGGPDGMYANIPGERLIVTRQGSGEDFGAASVPLTGATGDPNAALARTPQQTPVQMRYELPRFQADDLYATRYRAASDAGAPPATAIDPFTTPYQDLPEDQSGLPAVQVDDRQRRVVIFVDSNNNGRLDLQGRMREAYRTMVFQVGVKPDLKVETRERLLDFGQMWHGRLGPFAPAEPMLEWEYLQSLNPADPAQSAEQQFYLNHWRELTFLNTGNVNLTNLKPEVKLALDGIQHQNIGMPSDGTDPYRALTFLFDANAGTPGPGHIFIRTTFDRLLNRTPAGAPVPYLVGPGAWLQKAPVAASAPGAVIYNGDPTVGAVYAGRPGGIPLESGMTLNIPTGAPLGTYAGTIRFFNDLNVIFAQTGAGRGYTYSVGYTAPFDGGLNRSTVVGTFGEPKEPLTNPTVTLKVRVTENVAVGRFTAAGGGPDQDTRIQPAAAPVHDASGIAQRILMGTVSNMLASAPAQLDILGARLDRSPALTFFPYDQVPLNRPPWLQLTNPADGLEAVSLAAPLGTATNRSPSIAVAPNGAALIAWAQRVILGPGDNQYRILYRPVGATATPVGLGPTLELRPGGTTLDVRTLRSNVRMLPLPQDPTLPAGAQTWFAFYVVGGGVKRNIVFSATNDPANVSLWSPEHVMALPASIANASDPHVVYAPSTVRNRLPADGPFAFNGPQTIGAAWVLYSGFNERLGRTDLHLTRFDRARIVQAGQRLNPDPVGRRDSFGQYGFATYDGDPLRGNSTRTLYHAAGLDWVLSRSIPVEFYMSRADVQPGAEGSLTLPIRLLDDPVTPVGVQGVANPAGEMVFQLHSRLRTGNPTLEAVRVLVDPSAGSVRFTMDTRQLFRLLVTRLGSPLVPLPGNQPPPDPEVTGDYTPRTLRLTRSDFGASGGSVVFTQYEDQSWYRQQRWKEANPNAVAPYVAGHADRLWAFWRRAQGPVGGGPGLYYKVMRPGVRVRLGAIPSVRTADLQVAGPGGPLNPEEVDPNRGLIFFREGLEGSLVQVSYRVGGIMITERHVIAFRDETDETAVPMQVSVNEGTVDAFATYELAVMSDGQNPVAVPHLEKIWLFWSSTRGAGADASDIYYATIAPRIGPEPDNPAAIFNLAAEINFARRSGLTIRNMPRTPWLPDSPPPLRRRGPFVRPPK